MEILIFIMSVICCLFSFCFLILKITGANVFLILIIKILALLGTIIPILYWFKLYSII